MKSAVQQSVGVMNARVTRRCGTLLIGIGIVMADNGIWDMQANDCGHAESRSLPHCTLCPRCQVVLPFVADWSKVKGDLEAELALVGDFGAEDAIYADFLEEEIRRFS